MKQAILIITLFSLFSTSYAQFTYEHLEVDYAGAYQFRDLKIIPIRARPSFEQANQQAASLNNALSLRQALATNQAAIMEHSNGRGGISQTVNTLTIENFSDQPIFLMSGEIITGGMQDRAIAQDMVIPPRSGEVDVPVFCVEKGRWSPGTKRNKFKNYHEASMHLREVIDRDQNQNAVWSEIAKENRRDRVRTNTEAYTAHAKSREYIQREIGYLEFFNPKFRNKENIVGIVGVTGEEVMGCDLFATVDLFYREYNNLIYAYIDEALTFGVPITISDDAVRRYMDELLTDERSQERYVQQNGKMYKEGRQIIHITTY